MRPNKRLTATGHHSWLLKLHPPESAPSTPDIEPLLAKAEAERGGIVSAQAHDRQHEFLLFFNEERAMLLHFSNERRGLESMEVWEGPCLVASFPNRPPPDSGRIEYCCPNGDFYCASGQYSIPRHEAFLVLR